MRGFFTATIDRDLEEEMRFHLEMKARENGDAGMRAEEARDAARRRFGNVTATVEESRAQWIPRWLTAALKDLRFAWRLACRQALLSTAVVLTIAFGVGANTAIVSVLETVLLNPLGLRRADRVVIASVRIDRIFAAATYMNGFTTRNRPTSNPCCRSSV